MAVFSGDVSTDNLLEAVLQMPDKEFERFVEKAKKLRRKSSDSRWNKREIKLIKTLNDFVLSNEKQSRLNKLVKKRRAEKISQSELEELLALNKESEALNVKRMEIIAELAIAKNKTLAEIMDELGIRPPEII